MARGKIRGTKNKRKDSYFKSSKRHYNKKHNYKSFRKQDGSHFKKISESHPSEDEERLECKRKKLQETPEIEVKSDSDTAVGEQDVFKQFLSNLIGHSSKSKKKAIESDTSEEDVTDIEMEGFKLQEKMGEEIKDGMENDDSESESMQEEEDEKDYGQTEVDDALDPFIYHFHYNLECNFLESISASFQCLEKHNEQWPHLGQFVVHLPKVVKNCLPSDLVPKVTLEDKRQYAKQGTIPQRITTVNWQQLHIKTQIQNNISKANSKTLSETQSDSKGPLTPLQKEVFSIVNTYQDLYYPGRTLKNGEAIRFVYCLHSVNHILKTRTKILHHNQKLLNKDDVPEEYRDQGLVRPKVVILVPFRESALRVVKMIMDILLPDEKANIMNKKRFFDEFTGSEIVMPKKKPRPEDYEETFSGNTDDTFRIGITVTKKSLKLYADFYSADIIVASPLGLRVIVGAEGEEGRDFDFLASVELLVLDQAEIFLMQNWDHLLHILDHLHLQPREAHGTNFARVRSWALNGWARYYRQTLLFSSVMLPELNALINKKCHNYAGKICVVNPVDKGSICQVIVQVPQVFQRFDVNSVAQTIDARFDFFVKKILSQYKDAVMNHVLIYIPSYFDYVRLRNYFKKEGLNFVQICEYSKEGKIARARDMFFHDDAHFLLYSERFHFFRRPTIKGILHILFYQPPTFPHFYSEMCNMMQETNQNRSTGNESNMTVTMLYSKYDVQQLAAIVGTERAARMVNSERNVHMFMTGE